jgi:hypothetical protein
LLRSPSTQSPNAQNFISTTAEEEHPTTRNKLISLLAGTKHREKDDGRLLSRKDFSEVKQIEKGKGKQEKGTEIDSHVSQMWPVASGWNYMKSLL